jgi:hypothetical protein
MSSPSRSPYGRLVADVAETAADGSTEGVGTDPVAGSDDDGNDDGFTFVGSEVPVPLAEDA